MNSIAIVLSFSASPSHSNIFTTLLITIIICSTTIACKAAAKTFFNKDKEKYFVQQWEKKNQI